MDFDTNEPEIPAKKLRKIVVLTVLGHGYNKQRSKCINLSGAEGGLLEVGPSKRPLDGTR